MLTATGETNYIALIVVCLLFLGLLAWICKTAFWHKLAPVRTVKARVVAKDQRKLPSRYGTAVQSPCRVIFDVSGKTKAFTVSALSYGSYKLGAEGMLTYKGDRIIRFE